MTPYIDSDPSTESGPTLGVVGGGEIGRLLATAAVPFCVDVVVLDWRENPPASVAAHGIPNFNYYSHPGREADLARQCDLLTFAEYGGTMTFDGGGVSEILERVNNEDGITVQPTADTLRQADDILYKNQLLSKANIPVPAFRRVDDSSDLEAAVEEFGAVVLKPRRNDLGKYIRVGKDDVLVRPDDDYEAALDAVSVDAVAEAFVDFDRELSVIGVVGHDEIKTYPIGEVIREQRVLRETVVPARTTDVVCDRADAVARDVLDCFEGCGVYHVQLFEVDGDILVGEVSPRPHNAGHWTIEGAVTSQFEQHIRAVLGWPLGSTQLVAPTVSANILGPTDSWPLARLKNVDRALAERGVSLHWYGKSEAQPLRKMGHLTLIGNPTADAETAAVSDVDALLARARERRDELRFVEQSDSFHG